MRCAVSGQTKTREYSPASARRSTLASAWPLPSRHALTPSFVRRSTCGGVPRAVSSGSGVSDERGRCLLTYLLFYLLHSTLLQFVRRSTWSRASEMSGVMTRATPRQPLARLMTAGSM